MVVTSISIGRGKIPQKALCGFHKNFLAAAAMNRRKQTGKEKHPTFSQKTEKKRGGIFVSVTQKEIVLFGQKSYKNPRCKLWKTAAQREIPIDWDNFSTLSTTFSTGGVIVTM